MLIVLEGVDGAGKSTLTDRLLSTLPDHSTKRLHCGPLKGDPMRAYELPLRDYVPGGNEHIVCDRWHVGELVYGPLYRGRSALSEAMRLHVEMLLDKLGAYKLVVTTDMRTLRQRLAARGEDFLKPEHVGIVWDFYNEYAHKHQWQRVESDAMMSTIKTQATKLEKQARRISQYSSYVGSPHPRWLVLGAGASHPLPGRPHYRSAFMPYVDGHEATVMLVSKQIGTDFGMADPLVDDPQKLWHSLGRPNVMVTNQQTARLIPRHIPIRSL